MKHRPVELVHVSLNFGDVQHAVGRLALIQRRILFEFDPNFLSKSLDISPFKLPLLTKTFVSEPRPFDGLYGVFGDSLPDGWGRLLLDRKIRSEGVAPELLNPLDRLCYVGARGMGALCYEPDSSDVTAFDHELDLNKLASETTKVLHGEADEVFPELLGLSGSSGGARPKITVGLSNDRNHVIHGQKELPEGYSHWLVKFASSNDAKDAGAVEYAYSLMAKAAGIEFMPTHLFPAKDGAGYFGVQRFDRIGNQRLHLHSLAGLIHSDYQMPSLDYSNVLQATLDLTRNMREILKIFRIAVFNVIAHNRDDHAKNFAYLMDADGRWRVSPAYDLTFSAGPGGEQSMMVMGEGKVPGRQHLQSLAATFSISKTDCRTILDTCIEAVNKWPSYASETGVRKATINSIKKVIGA